MYCPQCGNDTVIDASEYVPADHDCLHCGAQFDRAPVAGVDAGTPDPA